jgi:hydrogenase-1 operon protein HyaE
LTANRNCRNIFADPIWKAAFFCCKGGFHLSAGETCPAAGGAPVFGRFSTAQRLARNLREQPKIQGNAVTTPLLRALTERYSLPLVDASSIDAFLTPAAGECPHALLFFTGDPAQRAETADVAAVLPELLAAFAGRLRGAVVAREAEAALKSRFQVYVLPSLVVARGVDPVGVLPKILDWSEYREKIVACLDPAAPVLVAAKGPKIEFTHSHGA